MHSGKVLVIDDDANIRRSLERVLRKAGYDVTSASNGTVGVGALDHDAFDVVITDLVMGEMDGMEVLKRLAARRDSPEVIMLTGYGTVERAVEAMKLGAYDFLIKPATREEVVKATAKALEKRALVVENRRLRLAAREREEFSDIVGTSKGIQDILDLVTQVAASRASVLIEGESGTGKELVARAIHDKSDRADNAFIAVNCAALPETLLEAELFGAVKGAYTGAYEDRVGRFEAADGGTFFLDEVSELSASAQVKLLRFLQDGEFTPVGSSEMRTADVRVVAASNRSLEDEMRVQRFRSDLYFRLNVVKLRIPPLRERRGDVPVLSYHFLGIYGERYEKGELSFTDDALRCLTRYDWPGNVRELENIVERAVVLVHGDVVDTPDLPPELTAFDRRHATVDGVVIPYGTSMAQAQRTLVQETLALCNGDKKRAAAMLGIGLRTIYRKLGENEPDELADASLGRDDLETAQNL